VVRLALRGIELTDDPAQGGELYIRAARSEHAMLGDNAEHYAAKALASFQEAGDELGLLRAATAQATMVDDVGRGNEGWALLTEVIEDGDTAIHADAYRELARAYMMDRRYEDSLEAANRALAIAERLDLIPIYTDSLITKATSLASVYRLREAITLMEAGLELARQHQLSKTKQRALNNLGVIAGSDRWFNPELLEEQLEDARRVGQPRWIVDTSLNEAWAKIWEFEWDRVDEILAGIDPDVAHVGTGNQYNDVVFIRLQLSGQAEEGERRYEAWWEELAGVGDAQQTGGIESGRYINAFYSGRFEEAHDRAMAAEFIDSFRFDIFTGLLSALRLGDIDRLLQVQERIAESQFRGRIIDWYRHAAAGGIAALEGREADAAEQWAEALRLVDETLPRGIAAWISAAAAASLGTDTPLGEERARLAYDAFTAVGAQTFLGHYPDGVLAPDQAVAEAGSA
jgi:tetratricopeptide (TPR) repeat protein